MEIEKYIKDARLENYSDHQIKVNLMTAGWTKEQVSQAFARVDGIATSKNPMHSSGVNKATSVNTPITKDNHNSTISIVLSCVLTASLLILFKKVIADIENLFSGDINMVLIVQSLIVLVMLVVSFFLHKNFVEQREKFKVLTLPYFLISLWVLILLVFKVSRHILNSNADFGVYFVLILVIGVLIGIIYFLQKYLKN
ncbi:MAG: hypothetical protein QG669_139 [Patescibacteria group bacterium]|jgi:O-antigen/teichoic acid export membrane protein|nr:hypothetical protein [Patescibacteria group bacterium]MDQ5961747.1 hypothetical protein [Patescibacteria group bacterium]